ncbi:MAG: class I SAM-dependent methyltransferase [Rhodospirillales bacterium]|nr:class I SAM-dependent methyltransferase [Rhodospirillales bacterium]
MMRDTGQRRRSAADLAAILRAYRRYAPTYDLIFGPVFQWGRAVVARRMNATGCARILEVGVGTGLSLPLYHRDKDIIGVDVSPEMLAKARRRVAAKGLANVKALERMDAGALDFEDGVFDGVVASFVMSVVPDPQGCLAEIARVCKPGGTVLVCNHFAHGADRWITPFLEPMSRWLGWHPNFALADLLESTELEVEGYERVPPFGLFTLLTLRAPGGVPADTTGEGAIDGAAIDSAAPARRRQSGWRTSEDASLTGVSR